MNFETFTALMAQNHFVHQEETAPAFHMTTDSLTPIKYSTTAYRFIRDNHFIIWVEAQRISDTSSEDFETLYTEITKGFHFFDDWKKAFKGSEFLIPIVENELLHREIMRTNLFYTRLSGIKRGIFTIDESMKEYDDKMNALIASEQK